MESKSDQTTLRWTRQAFDCYRLGSDCSKCEIPPMQLSSICQLATLLPKLLEQHGKPVRVHSKGRVLIMGEKQLGAVEADQVVFYKPHYQKVLEHVMRYPGITSIELQRRLRLAKWLVHEALSASFRLGILRKEVLQVGSVRYQQWFYVGNIQGI